MIPVSIISPYYHKSEKCPRPCLTFISLTSQYHTTSSRYAVGFGHSHRYHLILLLLAHLAFQVRYMYLRCHMSPATLRKLGTATVHDSHSVNARLWRRLMRARATIGDPERYFLWKYRKKHICREGTVASPAHSAENSTVM